MLRKNLQICVGNWRNNDAHAMSRHIYKYPGPHTRPFHIVSFRILRLLSFCHPPAIIWQHSYTIQYSVLVRHINRRVCAPHFIIWCLNENGIVISCSTDSEMNCDMKHITCLIQHYYIYFCFDKEFSSHRTFNFVVIEFFSDFGICKILHLNVNLIVFTILCLISYLSNCFRNISRKFWSWFSS